MRFLALGPFAVPLVGGKRALDWDQTYTVFDQADAVFRTVHDMDVRDAIGVYVFGLRPSGSSRVWPYYVGQACRQTLAARVFQKQDKVEKYGSILRDTQYKKATPIVFLFPLLTSTERLARLGSNANLITRAEYTLIGLARQANDNLWNSKHRVGMDAFEVDGAFNSVSKTASAASVRKMFDL